MIKNLKFTSLKEETSDDKRSFEKGSWTLH